MTRMGGMRTGFMFGSLIGLFAGMFLTSKSGHKVREELERTYEDTKNHLKNFTEETTENATETWENIQQRMYSTMDEASEKMAKAKDEMEIGQMADSSTSHKFQTKPDKAKTDALLQAFLASDGLKPKKNK